VQKSGGSSVQTTNPFTSTPQSAARQEAVKGGGGGLWKYVDVREVQRRTGGGRGGGSS
jgi:hypothetical protein